MFGVIGFLSLVACYYTHYLLITEFCPKEKRHIVSVFKIIQDLLAPSSIKTKNQFQLLIKKLLPNHKARWFAGTALNTVNASFREKKKSSGSQL